MDEEVKETSRLDGIDEEVEMLENKITSRFDNAGLTCGDVCRMIREFFVEYEEARLRRLMDDRCEKVVIALI